MVDTTRTAGTGKKQPKVLRKPTYVAKIAVRTPALSFDANEAKFQSGTRSGQLRYPAFKNIKGATLTFTIAARFNRDSHKSPTTPITQIATPAAQRRPRFIAVIVKTSSARSDNPALARGNASANRRHASPSRAKVVAVPRMMAPVTPTQVLFGLATANRPGVSLPMASPGPAAGDRVLACGCRDWALAFCFLRRALKTEPARHLDETPPQRD